MSRVDEAFERLRHADPLWDVDAAELSGQLGRLRARIAVQAAASPSAGRRERPRARQRLVAAAVVLLAVSIVAGTALALGVGSIDFFSSERAPARVELDFATLGTGAPRGMDPGVIAGETRKVAVAAFQGRSRTLWVAPTRQGGFCFLWSGSVAACDRAGKTPLSISVTATAVPTAAGVPDPAAAHGVALLGFVSAKYAAAVELRFDDGTVARPVVTWVSQPIQTGFFSYEPTEAQWRSGGRAVALDSDRVLIAERPLTAQAMGQGTTTPQADANLAEAHVVIELVTGDGRAKLWTAPTRYGGKCAWLEFQAANLSFEPCVPEGEAFAPFAFRFLPTEKTVLLIGSVADHVDSVEVRFADGTRVIVRPHDGFILYEVPERNLVAGHQAASIVGLDVDGRPLQTIAVDGLGGERFACLRPLPLAVPATGPFCLTQ